MNKLIAPVPNINGTDRQTLENEWKEVHDAARELRKALAAVTTHGRDWQTVGGGSTMDANTTASAAAFAVRDRIKAVKRIEDEAFAMRYHIRGGQLRPPMSDIIEVLA